MVNIESSPTALANEFLSKLRKKGNDEFRIKIAHQLYK